MNKFNQNDKKEPEIVYSRSVRAGRRIYYLDVKKARNEDLYVCITESKKMSGEMDESPSFEKHKLFLYKEDFNHFMEGLEDVLGYVRNELGEIEDRPPFVRDENEGVAGADAPESADSTEQEEARQKRGLFGLFGK